MNRIVQSAVMLGLWSMAAAQSRPTPPVPPAPPAPSSASSSAPAIVGGVSAPAVVTPAPATEDDAGVRGLRRALARLRRSALSDAERMLAARELLQLAEELAQGTGADGRAPHGDHEVALVEALRAHAGHRAAEVARAQADAAAEDGQERARRALAEVRAVAGAPVDDADDVKEVADVVEVRGVAGVAERAATAPRARQRGRRAEGQGVEEPAGSQLRAGIAAARRAAAVAGAEVAEEHAEHLRLLAEGERAMAAGDMQRALELLHAGHRRAHAAAAPDAPEPADTPMPPLHPAPPVPPMPRGLPELVDVPDAPTPTPTLPRRRARTAEVDDLRQMMAEMQQEMAEIRELLQEVRSRARSRSQTR